MSDLLFYRRGYQQLAPAMFSLMRHGVRFDLVKAAELRTLLTDRCDEIKTELAKQVGADHCTCGHSIDDHPKRLRNKWAGVLKKDGKPRKAKWLTVYPCAHTGERGVHANGCDCLAFTPTHPALHGKKDISSQKVTKYLYGELNLPKQKVRNKGGLTANEVALRKLVLKCLAQEPQPKATRRWKREPAFALTVLRLILDHREQFKLLGYVDPAVVDVDGRLRTMLKVTTEPGRLASASNPFGTGYNLQNIRRPGSEPFTHIRKIFLPDPGLIWWKVDYSQAEKRIVQALTKDPEFIRQARLRPSEFDSYTHAAKFVFSQILKCEPDEIDVKEEVVPGTNRRQLIKPIILAAPYGGGALRIQEMLLKDGVVLKMRLCQRLHDIASEQPILDYQAETRKRIWRDRQLVNSWGRRLDFTGCRLDANTYRRGYAFRGASENGDNLNQLGFIPAYHYCLDLEHGTRVQMQVHDEIAGSAHPSELFDFFSFLKESMEQPRMYEGVELAIPITYGLGINAMCAEDEGGVEWKELPSREEVEEVAWELWERCRVRDKEREMGREKKRRRAA